MSAVGVFLLFLAQACGGGAVTDAGTVPSPPVDTTKTGLPVVARGTLAVQVDVDAADADLARLVGISTAGLTVRITRNVESEGVLSAVTGTNGIAQFSNLLEGRYQLSVDRPLTAGESARLPVDARDVSILAAGTTLDYAPPARTTSVTLVGSRRGSLVLSEIFGYRSNGVIPYGFGTYYEVYNASDTTIYLDGVLLGSTWGGMHFVDATRNCATFNATKRLDPDGIWLYPVLAFPGTGRQYPMRPGEAKVVAMDALNHGVASPNNDQVDLSRADFEQIGNDADIDNPFVPDMVRVHAATGVLGRGYPVSFRSAAVLLLPAARARLERGSLEVLTGGGTFEAFRAPREMVLDLASIELLPSTTAVSEFTSCRPFLASAFERDPTPLGKYETAFAIARKSLGRTVGGVEVLQRTRTSARDFEYRTPLTRSLNRR